MRREKLNGGVVVKIFFLDPNSEAAKVRDNENQPSATILSISRTIGLFWDFRMKLTDEQKARLHIFVYRCAPCHITWVDDTMFVSHYLAGQANSSPVFVCEDGGDLYRTYSAHVAIIEEGHATELTPGNAADYYLKQAAT